MGRQAARSLTLDAGALIAFDRADARARALVSRARARQAPLIVPACALAQAWRHGARQARLAALAREAVVEPLDGAAARTVGELLGRSGTADIADAHVAVCTRLHGGLVATGDTHDLRELDPDLDIIEI